MRITFGLVSGEERVVDAAEGTSVMRAAVASSVPGIVGECGGQAMCATCHVYVRAVQPGPLPMPSEDESEMLELTAAPRDAARSRLGCQLKAGTGFTEITVDVPGRQV